MAMAAVEPAARVAADAAERAVAVVAAVVVVVEPDATARAQLRLSPCVRKAAPDAEPASAPAQSAHTAAAPGAAPEEDGWTAASADCVRAAEGTAFALALDAHALSLVSEDSLGLSTLSA
jgi:hypothetical protein